MAVGSDGCEEDDGGGMVDRSGKGEGGRQECLFERDEI